MPTRTAKRSYDSTRRARQAAETRADVLDAAIELFGQRGWAGTTLAAVAERAGVSVETIYKGFGSKKALLRAAMDVALVGDTDPVPLAERPEFLQLDQGTIADRVAHAAGMIADQHGRTAGVWQAAIEAAGTEEEMATLRRELEQRRRLDIGRGISRAVGHEVDDDSVTMVWLLSGPEAYRRLTQDLGQGREQYQAFIEEALRRVLADHL
jgi:AcrR family transcriptional regulator